MQKTFGNIVAMLEPNDDREGVQCWVEYGRHSCSLAVLSDFGTIGDDGPEVKQATIEAIENWAIAHGY